MSTKHKKKTNTNPNPNISKKWVQGADYNGFLQIRLLRRLEPTPKRRRSWTELGPKSRLGLHRDLEFRQIDQNDCVEIGVSDLALPTQCREFGSGLKKETSVIREVASRAVMDFLALLDAGISVPQESLELVGQAIDDIGSSIWKLMAEIVTHSVDKLFVAVVAGFESDSYSNNGKRLSSSSQVWIWVCVWTSIFWVFWGWIAGFLKMDCWVCACIFIDVWVCVCCFCVWLTRKISCWVCVCCFCVWLTRKICCWVCVCVSGFEIFGF